MILGWIEEGPRDKGSEDDAEKEGYARRWQRDRLAPLKESLPPEWATRYDELVSQLGAPATTTFEWSRTFHAGPFSPMSSEELLRMSVDDLLKYLSEWRPPKERFGPSREGLGRSLVAVFASSPGLYADVATRFQGLPPVYVHALFWGLRDALKANRRFAWRPVLDLIGWVLSRRSESACDEPADEDDRPDWTQARREVAALIDAGFEERDAQIEWELRDHAWNVLHSLTRDQDPIPEHERRYPGTEIDPASLSINTVRGQAMHAVVKYALWVRRHLEKLADSEARLAHGFAEMPEVRDVLELHLDSARDPSSAVHSIYGQWFPWLVLLDPLWSESQVDRIFPMTSEQPSLWVASWEPYITFCDAYDPVSDILQARYRHAIDQLGGAVRRPGRLADSDERLAEHLMILYWRGKASLEDPEGLLAVFNGKASPSLRVHALEFVGRSLSNTPDGVPSLILDRLQALWQHRSEAARLSDSIEAFRGEIAAFGWWFSSGKFPDQRAIDQLKAVLDIAGTVDPDHLVVERLAALAHVRTFDAVHCLDAIVRGDRDGWGVHRWEEHARSILQFAVTSNDGNAREAAIALINHLGTVGYLGFRDLLPE